MDRDKVGRMGEINALISHRPFKRATTDDRNLILAGDFNSPSHLDWTPEMQSSHCGLTCEWPVSKKLADNGFKDSYRIIHPGKLIDITMSARITVQDYSSWLAYRYYYECKDSYRIIHPVSLQKLL